MYNGFGVRDNHPNASLLKLSDFVRLTAQ
jgi:hypothetical protein